MKMNMMMGQNVAGQGFMPGAVAINGGVGVMELRRLQVNMDLLPSVDDVMNSVAAVAAEIAENAHITLRELKTKIDAVTEKKLPKFAQLMAQNPVAVAQTTVNGATLTAYQKDGSLLTSFDIRDLLDAVEQCAGGELRQEIESYIDLNVEDIDDYEKEYDRMDRELDMARDHQRQVLCNIMEEVDALDILLHDDRLNRKRMQGAVKIIRQMINREL